MSQVAPLSSAGTVTAGEDALNIDDGPVITCCLPHSAGSRSAVCTKVSTLNNSLICSSAILSARRHFSKTKRQRRCGKNQERAIICFMTAGAVTWAFISLTSTSGPLATRRPRWRPPTYKRPLLLPPPGRAAAQTALFPSSD